MGRLTLRVDLGPGARLGPGKVALLEAIAEHGSISAAARALRMSYRRAWQLTDDLNQIFGRPLVDAAHGGRHGGGATLTALARDVVTRYRRIERNAGAAAARDLAALDRVRHAD